MVRAMTDQGEHDKQTSRGIGTYLGDAIPFSFVAIALLASTWMFVAASGRFEATRGLTLVVVGAFFLLWLESGFAKKLALRRRIVRSVMVFGIALQLGGLGISAWLADRVVYDPNAAQLLEFLAHTGIPSRPDDPLDRSLTYYSDDYSDQVTVSEAYFRMDKAIDEERAADSWRGLASALSDLGLVAYTVSPIIVLESSLAAAGVAVAVGRRRSSET